MQTYAIISRASSSKNQVWKIHVIPLPTVLHSIVLNILSRNLKKKKSSSTLTVNTRKDLVSVFSVLSYIGRGC